MTASEVIARLRELRSKAAPGAWKAEPWGDGSTPPDALNIFAPEVEGTLAVSMFKDDAAAIVAAMNSLAPLLECASALATVRGCDVLPLVLARIADEALDALALAEGGGK